jgi:hypothetical protein
MSSIPKDDQLEKSDEIKPPYTSYTTFANCVVWLREQGLPARFDRSLWSKKYSGVVGPQLVSALRFLGLLDGETPTPSFHKLVEATGDARKTVLREVLESAYTKIPFEQLPTATYGMFTEWIRSYNVQGETIRKIQTFLLHALKDAGYELHTAIARSTRTQQRKSTGRKPRLPNSTHSAAKSEPSKDRARQPSTYGHAHVLQLKSGGTVTVTIDVNLFSLNPDDTTFVTDLVALIREYDTEAEGAT